MNRTIGIYMALGAAVGIFFGGAGIALGAGVGLAIGSQLSSGGSDQEEE